MKKRRWIIYILLGIVVLMFILLWISPVAFVKTGVLSKEKVDQYEKQYNLETVHKFDGTDESIKTVYLFYPGTKKVEIQDETMYAITDIEVEHIAPFFYKWKIPQDSWGVFRVTLENDKYYCLYITN